MTGNCGKRLYRVEFYGDPTRQPTDAPLRTFRKEELALVFAEGVLERGGKVHIFSVNPCTGKETRIDPPKITAESPEKT